MRCRSSPNSLPLGAFVLAAFASLIVSEAAANKVCSADLFSGKCQDLSKEPLDLRKSTTEADGVLFNYFLVQKREHYYELERFNATTSADLAARALEIANQVRDASIAYVTGGLPDESLSPEVASVVQRLRTVKLRVSDRADSDCLSRGDPGIPNAAYTAGEHTIGICPGQTKLPTQEIAATIAHELGHAVSPCTMMLPLVKFNEPKPETGSCLLKIGEGENRSKVDQEMFGTGPIAFTKPSDYAVDLLPEKTDELVRCQAAERLPGSAQPNPTIYKPFNSCIDVRYKTDYENWIAWKLFHLDKMPNFSSLPGKAREDWPKQVEALKQEVPFRCYVKNDEHFSDSFGGMVYSAWGKARDMTPSQFETGLHFLTSVQCVEKVTKSLKMKIHVYPPTADRIALHLKPRAVADLLSCSPLPSNICSLTEETFSPTSKDHGSKKSGTRP